MIYLKVVNFFLFSIILFFIRINNIEGKNIFKHETLVSVWSGIDSFVNQTLEKNIDDPINPEELITTINQLEEKITNLSSDSIEELRKFSINYSDIKNYQKLLSFFDSCYENECYNCLVDSCPSEITNKIIETLIVPTSKYRTDLSEFISDFIIKEINVNQNDIENNNCNNTVSIQTKVYEASKYIVSIIAKSYLMILLACTRKYNFYVKQKYPEAKQWKIYLMETIKLFNHDSNKLLHQTKVVLDQIPKDIRPCDPAEYKRGDNYDRFTNFMQPIFFNRLVYYSMIDEMCKDDSSLCHWYSYGILGEFDYKNFEKRNESLFNCTEQYNGDAQIFHDIKNTERMYSSIFFKKYKIIDDKFGRADMDLKHIDYKFIKLMCWVDNVNRNNTVRRLSLQRAEATIGYVVTGIRWRIINSVLYIEIQEGQLVNETRVDPTTVRWKNAIEDFNLTRVVTRDNRSFSLDDVVLPRGSLVTGVGFGDDVNGEIILNVYGKGENGIDTFASPSLNENRERNEIILKEADLPELTPHEKQQKILSKAGLNFVKFQPSDFRKDLSQTTVPYFDIQEIVTNPPTPIGGIGTYCKGVDGFGGFVGLKLLSIDYSNYLENDDSQDTNDKLDTVILKIKNTQIEVNQVNNDTKEKTEEQNTGIFSKMNWFSKG
ncbi:uncharacterized protein LOC122856523 [Aphidius gifuensis]|uniref:uncharacterized protein LOC122856523 n=1 Tax=Aphidius gifuensis TaxID=684658 RepID=UPI001CDC747F|nr:uncharacterized protein LOC122856523 [Aphidius gifuensis]